MTRLRWMALCFALGSTCFLIGPFPGYVQLVGESADAITFFVGSILFTLGGALQSWLAWPEWRSPGGGRAAWWAAIVQSAGTLFFNVTTYQAMHTALTSSEYDRLVWRPDWRGSICFLVSGAIAYRASPRSGWHGWLPARGGEAVPNYDDVSDWGGAENLVNQAIDAYGKLDILVNNAGITRDDLIMRMSVEAFREVLETNLFGAFYMTKAVTRPMLKAKGGRIVNITSVSGQAGQTGQANYSSAKAGLIGLTRDLAQQWTARKGIRVNALAPGFFESEMTEQYPPGYLEEQQTRIPVGRKGEGVELAATLVWLVSDAGGYVTGQTVAVDGGMTIT